MSVDSAGPAAAPTATDGSTVRLAAAMVALASTMFAISDAAGKLLSHELATAQIVWARYAFALPLILLATAPHARPTLLRVERPWLQIGRATLPIAASFAIIVALRHLPMAEVATLTFASPILVVALSTLVTGERPVRRHWVGVSLGFIGILVIVRPGANALAWAAVFPLVSATCFALFQLLTRVVGRSTPAATTLAWTLGAGFLMTTPLALLDWYPVDLRAWALLVLSGLSFGAAQYLLTRAFGRAPAATITPFTYAQIIPAIGCDYLLFGLTPDLVGLLGTGIVIAAGLYALGGRSPAAPARTSADSAVR